MAYYHFHWTDEIIQHLAENGVAPEDFEDIVSSPERRGQSRSTVRPCCWGETDDGRYLICVFEYLDELTILPYTAYEVRRPGD